VRIFQLHRDEDVSGVSGAGIVAEGVEWWDGSVTIKWFGADSSVVNWASIEAPERIHGHDGRTRFVFFCHELDNCPRDLADAF
jgi:hypothetical protein